MFRFIKLIRRQLGHDQDSLQTFDRLIWSTHVEDLRWIVNASAAAAVLAVAVIVVVALISRATDPAAAKLADALVPFHVSAVLAGFGGIVAWCYQTGSKRLGVVDLFACEITTLCRICTIAGIADNCIKSIEINGGAAHPSNCNKRLEARSRFSHFVSSEVYTPIFDTNAKDLQVLSAEVVTNITAFYTYWKAMRDAFRKLAIIPVTPATTSPPPPADLWVEEMRTVIYMQFLALESARKAVRDLIEFKASNAENTITILLSELPAYGSLRTLFPKENDARHERLELRRYWYQTAVADVYYKTKEEHQRYHDRKPLKLRRSDLEERRKDWDKAYRMLHELKERYEHAIGRFPSVAMAGE